MKIRFFYRILKREGGKRGIIMEVNNHVKAGYMPGREKRASGSQGKDFSAKMSGVGERTLSQILHRLLSVVAVLILGCIQKKEGSRLG